ncbi:MAG: response regulator transcription factor [Coriobacteriia bacterium]|nr:response regulator transcription factor [Coriobacteriia bacterium]
MFYCPVADLASRLPADPGDLVIADVGRSADEVVALAEEAAAAGCDIRLLLVADPDGIERLRMPVRLPADFAVRTASSAELAVRVRGLLWPGEESAAQEIVRVDDLTLNLATYQAYLGDVPVEFAYLEYALFAFLVTHPNRVYSREVLLRRVWGTDYFGGARTVDVHVRRVRAKLGPEAARRLETVRNVGYLWRQ